MHLIVLAPALPRWTGQGGQDEHFNPGGEGSVDHDFALEILPA